MIQEDNRQQLQNYPELPSTVNYVYSGSGNNAANRDKYYSGDIRELEDRLSRLEINFFILEKDVAHIKSFNQWLAQRLDNSENGGFFKKIFGKTKPIPPSEAAIRGTWPEYWSNSRHKFRNLSSEEQEREQEELEKSKQLDKWHRTYLLP